ncbi:TetR/AcrR family transcriptional regulator [Streptomyces sp. NBC_00654]|uniref:TetR/AcrR family transcriptional regulator n=1 Tax=Streptomyces sp. NBC_00654 TaxID=2975799 RepID=UPI002253FC28|nr:TetR/AcrR family transcriptional regulator [Streptomyces sp. NBC_00654]MCX4966677.1 TetR/AcrR family transcriptional regulator [Streptomyces sp. NBC_00654]
MEAAFELVADGGAAAMSIQAVAVRSGISRGSVAWHFGSKDGLLVAVVEEAFRRGTEFLVQRLETEPRGATALMRANHALMSRPEARIFSTLLLEAVTRESEVGETYARQYVALRRVYSDYLRSVTPELTAMFDADALAVAMLGTTLGINIQHRLDPDAVDRAGAVHVVEALYDAALASTGDTASNGE